ncbi:MAG: hypothetical protein JSU87_06170 [Gemmatimonadota bacterium]|nr:MAG: hypothetical protein JSU87_06170 [Gemmatimonadota bacterium]
MKDWRRILRRNWPYMLTGTLVSLFLWVAVSARTQAQQTIGADLYIDHDPRYVLTGREPALGRLIQLTPSEAKLSDAISVVLTGRAIDLAALSFSRPELFLSIDSVEDAVVEIELDPEDVRGRGGRELLDVRAVDLEPKRLRLEFEPREGKLVPVAPKIEVRLDDGFAVASPLRIEPSVVAVDGPATVVAAIDSVFTRRWVRERVRSSVDAPVPLEPPDPQGLVKLSTTSVRVMQRVEPRLERVFAGVPLRVEGDLAAGLGLEPAGAAVTVAGPQGAVEVVQESDLEIWVEVAGVRDTLTRLPVLFRAPGPYLEISVEPDSVRLVSATASGS